MLLVYFILKTASILKIVLCCDHGYFGGFVFVLVHKTSVAGILVSTLYMKVTLFKFLLGYFSCSYICIPEDNLSL